MLTLSFHTKENGMKWTQKNYTPLSVIFNRKLKEYSCFKNPSPRTLNLLKGACCTTLTTSIGSFIWQFRLQQQHFQDPSIDVCSDYIATLSTFCISTGLLIGCTATYNAVTNDKQDKY